MAKSKYSRAWDLYNLLTAVPNKWWSQKEITEFVDGYTYYERNNDRCPEIREDMLYLNSEEEFEKLIICKNYCFKVAEREDLNVYYRARIRRLKAQVKQLKSLEYKMRRDGHFDILDHKWWDTYWNNDNEFIEEEDNGNDEGTGSENS